MGPSRIPDDTPLDAPEPELPADLAAELDERVARAFKHYNRQGEIVSFTQWCRLQADDPDYRRVAEDIVEQEGASLRVSTVLLGIEHPGGIHTPEKPDDKPLIFETMVFVPDGNHYTHRYATEADAVEGHKLIVESLKAGKPIPLEDQGLEAKLSALDRLMGTDFLSTLIDPQ
jgi:hypothetical protein